MFRLKTLLAVPLVLTVAACANTGTSYTPIVDGPVGPNFANDLAQCQQIARQQGTLDGGTATAALTGAALGGGTAALINNRGSNARDAALIGAALAGTASAAGNVQNQEIIIRNCMRGRGYNVVG